MSHRIVHCRESPHRSRHAVGRRRAFPLDLVPSALFRPPMFSPPVIRHPNGPLRPSFEMRLRRRMLRSRGAVVAAVSVYGLVSLGLLGMLARLSFG